MTTLLHERTAFRQLASGRSLFRILADRALATWRPDVKGTILNLASGHTHEAHGRFWKIDPSLDRWIAADIDPMWRPNIIVDLTRPLPFRNEVADTVVLTNFIHIPEAPNHVLHEIARVLRPLGTLILNAPLIYNVEPTDHWRYTSEGLSLLASAAGLRLRQIVPVGGPWTAAAYILARYIRPRRLFMPAVGSAAILMDMLTAKHQYEEVQRCPIGYCLNATKP